MYKNIKYIYLPTKTDQENMHKSASADLYLVYYDSYKITNLINDYSLKTGGKIVKKYENNEQIKGRIISKKFIHSPNANKVINLGTHTRGKTIYTVIENESEFIKALIKAFKYYQFSIGSNPPYVLLDFKELYDLVKRTHINDEDILFLRKLLNEFEFEKANLHTQKPPIGSRDKKNSLKNEFVLILGGKTIPDKQSSKTYMKK